MVKIRLVKVISKKPKKLKKVYFIKDTELGNYISDKIVSKNCSTSLELGIDIGSIDVVVQISSPKSVTRAIQRIGRSGHSYKDKARGILIGVTRDDLMEQSVIGKGILERKLDKIHIPKNCLDVLAQHIIGMSLEKDWKVEEAYNLVKRCYCFKDLSFEDFMSVIRYLAGYYEELEYRKIYAKIRYDEENKVIKKKKNMRVIYMTNVGTIPEEVKVDVYIRGTRKLVGQIEEEYLEKLKPGDVFVLGGKTYRFIYSKGLRAYVEPAVHEQPNVPAWFSELLPLSFDTALELCKLRRILEEKIKNKEPTEKIVEWLVKEYPITKKEAYIIVEYVKEQVEYTGYVPHDKRILIEYTKDLNDNCVVIFHTCFGRKVNEILSRAVASVVAEEAYTSVPIYLNDYAFALVVPDFLFSENFEKYLRKVNEENIVELVKKNIVKTEMFKIRFRHVATRGFLILRSYMGKKISLERQQLQAETLVDVLLKFIPDFPLIKETIREIIEDVMDIENAKKVIRWIHEGKIEIKKVRNPEPSPFAHLLLATTTSDILKIEDRQRVLKELHERIKRVIELRRKFEDINLLPS